MSSKYKYLFKFGRGSSATELLGPSIAYFWNDIYDVFDIERKMIVERLDGKEFSIAEIKRIFGDLSEDMEEDFAEIWLEIQNGCKRLLFLESNILPGISLDEQQQLLEEYLIFFEKPLLLISSENYRILNFTNEKLIVLLVYSGSDQTVEEWEVDALIKLRCLSINQKAPVLNGRFCSLGEKFPRGLNYLQRNQTLN